MAAREILLTEGGSRSLGEEIHQLKTVRRQDVAARIHKASETGGTVDNAEYDEAKNEQAFVEGRIREIDDVLSNAVIAPSTRSKVVVEFGSAVTVKNEQGKVLHYTVVGSAEAAPSEGKISNESPVGKALLGHAVGDAVEVQTPSRTAKLTITKVR